MIISSYAPKLLGQDRDEFFINFFHPSFLVRNIAAGYEYGQFIIPDHPIGLDLPKIINIDCDSDTIVTEALIKMPPTILFSLDDYKGKNKRGQPRNKCIRSRGTKSGDGEDIRNKNKNRDGTKCIP